MSQLKPSRREFIIWTGTASLAPVVSPGLAYVLELETAFAPATVLPPAPDGLRRVQKSLRGSARTVGWTGENGTQLAFIDPEGTTLSLSTPHTEIARFELRDLAIGHPREQIRRELGPQVVEELTREADWRRSVGL